MFMCVCVVVVFKIGALHTHEKEENKEERGETSHIEKSGK